MWRSLPKVVFSTTLSTVQGNARLAFSGLPGLPQMMGTRHPRNVVLTRKNGRDCPNGACDYASL